MPQRARSARGPPRGHAILPHVTGPAPAHLSRRSALAAAAAAAGALTAAGGLSACTAGSTAVPPGPSRTSRPSVETTARRRAGATETALAALAGAIATTYADKPAANQRGAADLVALSQAAGGAHLAHATALLHGLPDATAGPTPGSAPPASTSSPSSGPSASAPAAVPATVRAAASALVIAQEGAAAQHLSSLPEVTGTLAALLASVAASDAAFASTLRPLTGSYR
jgi:hypothetical protein